MRSKPLPGMTRSSSAPSAGRACPTISRCGALIPIRRVRQYVNLRPVRMLLGVNLALAGAARATSAAEGSCAGTSEGEYSQIGSRTLEGFRAGAVVQETVFTGAASTASDLRLPAGAAPPWASPRPRSRTASSTPCPIGTTLRGDQGRYPQVRTDHTMTSHGAFHPAPGLVRRRRRLQPRRYPVRAGWRRQIAHGVAP